MLLLSTIALAWTTASTTAAVGACRITGEDSHAIHTHGGPSAVLRSARFTATCDVQTTLSVVDVTFVRGHSCDALPSDVASRPAVEGLTVGGKTAPTVVIPAGVTTSVSVQFSPVEAYYTYCNRFAFQATWRAGAAQGVVTAETQVSREEPYRE